MLYIDRPYISELINSTSNGTSSKLKEAHIGGTNEIVKYVYMCGSHKTAKELDSGFEIIHQCFTERGNSILSCELCRCTHSHTLSLSNVKFYSRMFSHKLILPSLCVYLIPQRVQYEETITIVFQASAHYRVGRHASSHFVGMESTHSRASAQVYFLRSKLSPAIISG